MAIFVNDEDMFYYQRIGDSIRKNRNLAHLSQEDLAQLIGCSAGHIHDVERGKGGLSGIEIRDICKVLCMTPNEMFAFQQKLPEKMIHTFNKLYKVGFPMKEFLELAPDDQQAIMHLIKSMHEYMHKHTQMTEY